MKPRGRYIDPHAQKGLKEGETALGLLSQTKKNTSVSAETVEATGETAGSVHPSLRAYSASPPKKFCSVEPHAFVVLLGGKWT